MSVGLATKGIVSGAVASAAQGPARIDGFIDVTMPALAADIGECSGLLFGMNLANLALYQRKNFGFNSFMKIGDKVVGATTDGLFEFGGSSYPEENIESVFELATTNLGSKRKKRFRRLYFGGRFGGNMRVRVKFDDGEFEEYPLVPVYGGLRSEEVRVPVSREQKGYHFTIRLENSNGSDFSLDMIDAEVVFGEK